MRSEESKKNLLVVALRVQRRREIFPKIGERCDPKHRCSIAVKIGWLRVNFFLAVGYAQNVTIFNRLLHKNQTL